MTILVISHTGHYYDTNGNIVGLGATVKEIDYLAETFGSVIHVACLHKNTKAPKSALPYTSKKVRYVPIPEYGGDRLKDKISIFTNALTILKTIKKELKNADIFQFRAPTAMGIYVIPFLTYFSKKKGWYKYAGNWMQPHPPLSYSIQKSWLLKMQQRPITINGEWPNQPAKCHTFENPCLNSSDRDTGLICCNNKSFAGPFTFCFVGRLEREKGIFSIINSLKGYPDISKIAKLEVVGEGSGLQEITNMSESLPFPVNIHGAMAREGLFEIYKNAHFIILPSESEGFPKVIAEAANFGCIPIVSDVSCIGQYINATNGYLWNKVNGSFETFFEHISLNDDAALKTKATKAHEFAGSFTYERYVLHLKEFIFKTTVKNNN